MLDTLQISHNFTDAQDIEFKKYLKANNINFTFCKRQLSDYIFYDITVKQAFDIGLNIAILKYSKELKNNNNYFTFLGVRYEGDFNDAWALYKSAQTHHVFKDFLKENIKTVN